MKIRVNVVRFVLSVLLTVTGLALVVGSGGGGSDPPTPPAPPTITVAPASITVVDGQSAAFTVAASGTEPFTYQWRRNGVDIAGATASTYSISIVSLGDNGAQFSVVVGNSAGSATSANATLTVSAIVPDPPTGTLALLAGHLDGTGNVDGAGAAARFRYPGGVSTDSTGNVYVADTFNCTIRKISSAGVVTTLAGKAGSCGASVSFSATGSAARFYGPGGIAADSGGNIYVADGDSTIRKVTAEGVVTTLAGASLTSGSADGIGTAARFGFFGAGGVAADTAGNVYVADTNNGTIRKITLAGAVTTLAGLAGSFARLDGAGAAARFEKPSGIAVGSSGDIYVADASAIRRVTPTGVVTTLPASIDKSGSGVAVDSAGNVYVTSVSSINKISPTGVVTVFAGEEFAAMGSSDGTGPAARFRLPTSLATDSAGSIYVADSGNHSIRKITSVGNVTTLAGTADANGSADGAGAAARFDRPLGVATDSTGNVYLADSFNNTIRKIRADGTVTTLAGKAGLSSSGSVDGIGSAARFNDPSGVATDSSGNVYVADSGNNTIRKITQAGIVTTLAGTPGSLGSADGIGAAARFTLPSGVATDSTGNVYVADSANRIIRKITPAGVVTTFAGSAGPSGLGSADGAGAAAQFRTPTGIATDGAGNVYVADSVNMNVRKIAPDGVVTTLAGAAQQNLPGSTDGNGSAARFSFPSALTVDSSGNVYVADTGNHTIRKITPTGAVTTVVGRAGVASFVPGKLPGLIDLPSGVAIHGDSIYIAMEHGVAVATLPTSSTTPVAASITAQPANAIVIESQAATFSVSATGTAPLSYQWRRNGIDIVGATSSSYTTAATVLADSGAQFAVVVSNSVGPVSSTAATLTVNPVAPVGTPSITLQPTSVTVADGLAATFSITVSGAGPFTYQWRKNGVDIPGATAASYTIPNVQSSDSGAAYSVVVRNSLSSVTSGVATLTVSAPGSAWVVSTIAGVVGEIGFTDGSRSEARIAFPNGTAVDNAGNVYFTDVCWIRRITAAGVVSRFAGGATCQTQGVDGTGVAAGFNLPIGLAIDGTGNLWAADSEDHTIRRISTGGVATTVLGLAGQFDSPAGNPYFVATDGAGNVYVADYRGHTIRKITPDGVMSTLAGEPGQPGSVDGVGTSARFNYPLGIAADPAGNVYVSQVVDHTIRKISPGGVVSTYAGVAGQTGSVDGDRTTARFDTPYSLAADAAGNVYVSDSGNFTIRKISAAGVVSTIAGAPKQSGYADGVGSAARFADLRGISVDRAGNLYVPDYSNQTIRKIAPPGQPTLPPAALGCASLSSGKYRFLNPYEAATNPDAVVRLMTVDAVAMTLSDDSAPGTPAVAITPDATTACSFTVPRTHGTGTWRVSRSGLGLLRQPNASGQTVVSVIVPEQSIAASELAGTWNFYTHHRLNIPLNGNAGTFVVDATGVNTSGADCIGLAACVPWSSMGSRFGSFVTAAGGGFNAGGMGGMRAFALRNASGALSLYIVTPLTGSLTFATPQVALNLPAVGSAFSLWGFSILENSEVVSAVSSNAFTITAADAVAQTYTRTRTSDSTTNVFRINMPRNGLRYRAGTTNPNTLEIINMPLTGTGVSLTLTVNPPNPSLSGFEMTIETP